MAERKEHYTEKKGTLEIFKPKKKMRYGIHIKWWMKNRIILIQCDTKDDFKTMVWLLKEMDEEMKNQQTTTDV